MLIEYVKMPFNKYDMLSSLSDCTDEWLIRVKAQAVWRGVNRSTGEFKGLNIVFFDDSVSFTFFNYSLRKSQGFPNELYILHD